MAHRWIMGASAMVLLFSCGPQSRRGEVELRAEKDEVWSFIASMKLPEPKYVSVSGGYVELTWYGVCAADEIDRVVDAVSDERKVRGWGTLVLIFNEKENMEARGNGVLVRGNEVEVRSVVIE